MLVILVKALLILVLIALGPVLIAAAVMAGRKKKVEPKGLAEGEDPFSEFRGPLEAQLKTDTTDTVTYQTNYVFQPGKQSLLAQWETKAELLHDDYESAPRPGHHYQVDYKCEEVVKKSKKKKSKKNKKKSKKNK